ncbi:hypothetical protein [Mucilaginibacter sp.]|uniref:hypothetical protein n=1 Tax=Mucilaginibacter sp. TaxID=1882438 RepID=UPI0025E7101C|nr:hypothetical protein [Mucilaginibacter sp.]
MTKIKFLFLSVFITVSSSAFAQTADHIFLKWKLKPNEVLSYKTVMEEIDTANRVNFGVNGMFKSMGIDSANAGKMQQIFKELNSVMQQTNLVTSLTENRKGIIDIAMVSKPDKSKAQDSKVGDLTEMQKLMKQFSAGVMLRGAIYEDGTIESFYTKGEQKNMIAMLFELPGKPIKQGDTYSLTVNLLTADQSFICDSSYHKNRVKVLKIENRGGEHVVTLQYDVAEYIKGDFNSPMGQSPIKTTMAMSFQGLAEFSVEKGKWISYNGLIDFSSTGIMSSQTKKRYALIEEK